MVLEIEGDLKHLRWTGHVLQRPRFDPEVREQRGNIPGNQDRGAFPGTGTRSIPWNRDQGTFPGMEPGAFLGIGNFNPLKMPISCPCPVPTLPG